MTTFTNGPAQGQTLMLRRAPFFLRVVKDGSNIDALDQLSDEPAVNEAVHVYIRQPGAEANAIHLNVGRGKDGKRGGGWFSRATYQLCPVQPGDDVVRSVKAWESWCQQHKAAEHEPLLTPEIQAAGWLPMWAAPRRCESIRVLMRDGSEHPDVHFAEDLSGEEQPAFSGWFIPAGRSFLGISDPLAWQPIVTP
ncbi:MAG: hypothetical protein V4662_11940 [Verrucomicrobiota bacterium]